ncbi:hypothetical protein K469DRAFT_161607 [Zopfia rhizophila CBS 207.26]|uniref:Uncharacterized protein n=1 Tax=Zopfia rhizophila CBS 207.26 TaxID=1314779 RepID=A0A6A6E2Y3_9PEZI|nr:hypothetical protein K469DRAFT_161607 [Zopfia rhizophila CBS 207.26]
MARSLSRPRPRSSSPAQRKRQRISGGRDSSVPTSPPRTTALVDKLFSQSLPNENLDTPDDPLHSPRTSEPLQSTSPQASPNQSQNIGNPDDPPHLPRKPRSKTSKPAQVPLWPKRKHPDISKSQVTKRRNAYKAKWSEPPQKPAKGTTMPYKLQVLSWFFGNQISERRREEGGEQPVARCYTCKSHGTKMPSAEDAPDGTEVRECAPCGCDFAVC